MHVDLPGPMLLARCWQRPMRMIGDLASAHGVDTRASAGPGVPAERYHLPCDGYSRARPRHRGSKHAALWGGGLPARQRPAALAGPVHAAFFVLGASSSLQVALGAVVLGLRRTVCETTPRFDPPAEPVADHAARLLEAGLRLGFGVGARQVAARGPAFVGAQVALGGRDCSACPTAPSAGDSPTIGGLSEPTGSDARGERPAAGLSVRRAA